MDASLLSLAMLGPASGIAFACAWARRADNRLARELVQDLGPIGQGTASAEHPD